MFAKLFDTSAGQLLVTKDTNEDEPEGQQYGLTQRGEEHRGIKAEITGYFDSEEDRDAAFAGFNSDDAERQAVSLHHLIDQLTHSSEEEQADG